MANSQRERGGRVSGRERQLHTVEQWHVTMESCKHVCNNSVNRGDCRGETDCNNFSCAPAHTAFQCGFVDAVRKLVLWELLCAPWDHDVWEQEYVYSKCGERPHALAITMKAAKEQGFCWGMFDDSIA